jgi:hypothetical protein
VKTISLTLRNASPQDAKQATAIVAKYRESGNGSNRANWERVTLLLSAVLTVLRTGDSVEVSSLFPAGGSDKVYHTAHRALSHGAIRPYWGNVVVIGMRNTTRNGKTVTGETTTQYASEVFIALAE